MLKILIVEDEPPIAHLIRLNLAMRVIFVPALLMGNRPLIISNGKSMILF